jgi:protease-4
MKQFFKFFTASCLGVFAAIAMISLVGMLMISMASSKDTTVASNSILKLDLSRIIPEKSGNVKTDPFNMDATEAIGLRDLRRTIQNAAEDSNIKGILLTHKDVSLGQATIKSIVDELNRFKESGKWIYSYGDYYGQSAYFVNSTADSIFLNPNGMVDVKGYATMIPFFKEGMDKLGVKFDIFYAGNFKSATEPFRRSNMSEPNKLQTRTFLDGMLDVFQEQVTTARGFDVATLDAIMNDYKGINGKSALQANLVDELLFWDDLQDILRKKLDIKENGKIEFIDLEELTE